MQDTFALLSERDWLFILDQPAILLREFVGTIKTGFGQRVPAHLLAKLRLKPTSNRQAN